MRSCERPSPETILLAGLRADELADRKLHRIDTARHARTGGRRRLSEVLAPPRRGLRAGWRAAAACPAAGRWYRLARSGFGGPMGFHIALAAGSSHDLGADTNGRIA